MTETREQFSGQACFWCGQSLAEVAEAELVNHKVGMGVTIRTHRICEEKHQDFIRTFEATELQRWRESGDFSEVRCFHCGRVLQEVPRTEIFVQDVLARWVEGRDWVSSPRAYHLTCWSRLNALSNVTEPEDTEEERSCDWCEEYVDEEDEEHCEGCDALVHTRCLEEHLEACQEGNGEE
jgi:DNA-directed RNA polymerase subunit N (RpoN/RPB10)